MRLELDMQDTHLIADVVQPKATHVRCQPTRASLVAAARRIATSTTRSRRNANRSNTTGVFMGFSCCNTLSLQM